MKKKGYVLFRLPGDTEIRKILNTLTELGTLESTIEERGEHITVMDLWDKRSELRTILRQVFPELMPEAEFLGERDWNREWIEGFQPIRIRENFWITPPWQRSRVPQGSIDVIINPANAFGTGTHESTRLVLELLPGMLNPGDKVLDLGCGSGILSIAARKLGAETVLAVDNDPEIRENFTENVTLNRLEDIPLQIADVLQMDDYFCDLALVNIQKHIILPLLERFNVAKGAPKRVILAGLLNEHRDDVLTTLDRQGYEVLQTPCRGLWMAVAALRRRTDEI